MTAVFVAWEWPSRTCAGHFLLAAADGAHGECDVRRAGRPQHAVDEERAARGDGDAHGGIRRRGRVRRHGW